MLSCCVELWCFCCCVVVVVVFLVVAVVGCWLLVVGCWWDVCSSQILFFLVGCLFISYPFWFLCDRYETLKSALHDRPLLYLEYPSSFI